MRKSLLLTTAFVMLVSYLAIGQQHNPVHYRNTGSSAPEGNSFGGGGAQNTSGTNGAGANIDVIYHKIFWRINPDSTKYIKGSVQTNFKTISAGVTSVSFDMNSVLVADSVYFRGAKLAAGNINHSGNIIIITLGATLANNFIDSVTIFYKGPPPAVNVPPGAVGYQKASDATAGNYIYTLSESYEDRDWWPCKADMQDKIDSMDITISVPWAATAAADTFWAASNGVLIDSSTFYGSGANSSRLFKFKTRYPIPSYLVAVGVAKYSRYYRTITVNGTNVPVAYNLFKGKSAGTLSGMLTKLDEQNTTLAVFSSKFGDYPFKNEKHGFYEFGYNGGMEHQTFSGISTAAMTSPTVLSHELMHQWFGDNVTFSTWNDLWLAEGFASYGEALYYELVGNSSVNAYNNRKTNKTNGLAETVSTWIPDASCNTSGLWNSSYGSSVYDRGGVIVAMLRALSGDNKFYQALTDYQTKRANKSASTDTLRDYFNIALGIKIDPFFKDYVGGSGPAAAAVGGVGNPINTVKWNSPSANKLVLSMGTQTKSATNNVSYFRGPVVVRFTAAGNDTTINFFDWGGGFLSYAGNGMSDSIAGNRLVYNLSFTPAAAVYDDSARTLSTGSMSPDATLNGYIWTGASSSTWGTAANWLNSAVPVDGSEVTIATSVNQPALTANIKLTKLTINAGSVLNLNNFNLTLNGSLFGTGTITGSASSGITINKELGSHTIETSAWGGTIYFTQTSAATRSLASLTINNGGTLTLGSAADLGNVSLNAASTLDVGGNTLTVNGAVNGTGSFTGSATANIVINGAAGTLNFTQSSAATRSLNNIILSAAASATLGSDVDVYGNIKLNDGALNFNSKNVVLKSNAANTASIDKLLANGSNLSGANNVTMERWIPLRSAVANGGRAYRVLGSTVTTTGSINDNWQEGLMNTAVGTNLVPGSPNQNFGVQITGSTGNAAGFDVTSTNQPSLYTFTPGSDVTGSALYIAATSTSGILNAQTGYFLYIRGDRNTDMQVPYNPAGGMLTSSTTLRAKGTMLKGNIVYSILNVNNNYTLITNPYPAPIDWNLVSAGNSNISASYILWNSNQGTRGGFMVVPAGTGNYTNRYIQPGEAFFVASNGTGASITITEAMKAVGNNNNSIYRPVTPYESFAVELMFTEANSIIHAADEAVVRYGSYIAGIDANDVDELTNWNENIAISRASTRLALESRPVITARDTIPLYMNNMRQAGYELLFTPSMFTNTGLVAELLDNYLGTRTLLSVINPVTVPFTVSGNAASAATNRFKVVFGNGAALPVDGLTIHAQAQPGGTEVGWTSSTEINMDHYEVERAANSSQFSKQNNTAAIGNSSLPVNYNWLDAAPLNGDNFYRIKAIDKSGVVKYSSTVKIAAGKGAAAVWVYPNPIAGNSFTLQIKNLDKGNYTLTLYNTLGQQVYSMPLQHSGGSSTRTVEVQTDLPQGQYQMRVTGAGLTQTSKLIKN